MSAFEVVRYRPVFKDRMVELRSRAYGFESPDSREYLEWKYERNPYLSEPLLHLAVDGGGNVAGMRGFYGTRWRTPGGDVTMPCADDFAIAPEHRNSGLTTAIMRVALEDLAGRGFEHVINTSGGRVTVLHSLATGWKSVGAMEPVARVSLSGRARAAVRGRARGKRLIWRLGRQSDEVQPSDARCFERLDNAGGRSVPGGSIVVETVPRTQAMADLVARIPCDGRIRHARDRAFFDWRFANPWREYRFVYLERDGRLEGYLVLARHTRYRPPMVPFRVADWEGTSAEIRRQLFEFTLAHGRFPSLSTWTASCGDEDRALLERSGFRPAELDLRARGLPCVLLRRLSGSGDWRIAGVPALDRANWDVRLIDSMHA